VKFCDNREEHCIYDIPQKFGHRHSQICVLMFFIAISLTRHIVFKKIWIDMKINFTTFFVTYSRWDYLSV
jgi:hypothetical protein